MKLARIAIFLTGVMGLSVGGLVTIASLRANQERELIKTNETLKSQATLLVDQFYSVLESAKRLGGSSANDSLPYVMDRGVVKLKDGVPVEFESFSSTDLNLEERVMNGLKAQLSIGDLQLIKVGLGTFEMSEANGKLGFYVALPVFKNAPNSNGLDPQAVDKVNVALIDPAKAFAGLDKFSGGTQSAYLLSKNGKVLAHSLSAFVGTDLKKLSGLKDVLENLFIGAQTGLVTKYTQVDGTREAVAIVRAGVFPFAFAVEQKAVPAVLSSEWMSEQFDSGASRNGLGMALVLIAIALVLFSVMSAWASHGLKKELAKNAENRPATEPDFGFSVGLSKNKVAPGLAAISNATDTFAQTQIEMNQAREEARENARSFEMGRDFRAEFIEKTERSHSLEFVEKELTDLTSQLVHGQVLYFRYQRGVQTLALTSVSAGVQIDNYQAMQAYVRKDIELQVEQLSDTGKIASLTHYAPVKKILQNHFQGKSFEAWAVTSTAEISQQAKLVGLLVVVDPNAKIPTARAMLAAILKDAGNALLVRGNKLKPKNGSGNKRARSNEETALNDLT
jgi:hypothetical protein